MQTSNMQWSPWVLSSDGIAYSVKHTSQACKTKAEMNVSTAVEHTQWLNSCVLIAVDVNGLTSGPNMIEPQVQDFDQKFINSKNINKLTGDIYFIYIGSDGVSSGSPESTLTGRLLAGLN